MKRRVFKVEIDKGIIIIVPTINKVFLQAKGLPVPDFIEDDVIGKENDILDVNSRNKFSFYNVMFFPTARCNLRCIYCYAGSCEKGSNISLGAAYAAVDLVLTNCKRDSQPAWIRFHGGGEPTLAWTELKAIVSYARKQGKKNCIPIKFSITTNGIFGDTKRKFLAKNMDYINLSFDGTEEIQNFQRPMPNGKESFSIVFETAKFFYENKIKFGLRSSITPFSLSKMIDIINFFADNFPETNVAMEPVDVSGRKEESEIDNLGPSNFSRLILEADKVAKNRNVKLAYGALDLRIISNHYCGTSRSNFIVTPEGYVTSCSRVCSITDPGAELFIFGYYDPEANEYVFDEKKHNLLQSISVDNMPECKDCFAAWLCQGGCPMTRYIFNQGDVFKGVSPRCEDKKKLIIDFLSKRLDSTTI